MSEPTHKILGYCNASGNIYPFKHPINASLLNTGDIVPQAGGSIAKVVIDERAQPQYVTITGEWELATKAVQ